MAGIGRPQAITELWGQGAPGRAPRLVPRPVGGGGAPPSGVEVGSSKQRLPSLHPFPQRSQRRQTWPNRRTPCRRTTNLRGPPDRQHKRHIVAANRPCLRHLHPRHQHRSPLPTSNKTGTVDPIHRSIILPSPRLAEPVYCVVQHFPSCSIQHYVRLVACCLLLCIQTTAHRGLVSFVASALLPPSASLGRDSSLHLALFVCRPARR